MILIDSNVVIDMLSESGEWKKWSTDAVADAGADSPLAVTPVVVAEVAPRAGTLEKFLEGIGRFGVSVVELDSEAAFAAGTAFNIYRNRKREGTESTGSIIADFLIGGQALALQAAIVTRDPRFYRTYFPSVPLITPDKATP